MLQDNLESVLLAWEPLHKTYHDTRLTGLQRFRKLPWAVQTLSNSFWWSSRDMSLSMQCSILQEWNLVVWPKQERLMIKIYTSIWTIFKLSLCSAKWLAHKHEWDSSQCLHVYGFLTWAWNFTSLLCQLFKLREQKWILQPLEPASSILCTSSKTPKFRT